MATPVSILLGRFGPDLGAAWCQAGLLRHALAAAPRSLLGVVGKVLEELGVTELVNELVVLGGRQERLADEGVKIRLGILVVRIKNAANDPVGRLDEAQRVAQAHVDDGAPGAKQQEAHAQPLVPLARERGEGVACVGAAVWAAAAAHKAQHERLADRAGDANGDRRRQRLDHVADEALELPDARIQELLDVLEVGAALDDHAVEGLHAVFQIDDAQRQRSRVPALVDAHDVFGGFRGHAGGAAPGLDDTDVSPQHAGAQARRHPADLGEVVGRLHRVHTRV
mmetsp:Transcript_13710/g.40485  ORF Transcript_13710/g.40485 Transcript_13710/m.40485 type:complete len:282 (-) Transcript_13710:3445-4290(-)